MDPTALMVGVAIGVFVAAVVICVLAALKVGGDADDASDRARMERERADAEARDAEALYGEPLNLDSFTAPRENPYPPSRRSHP